MKTLRQRYLSEGSLFHRPRHTRDASPCQRAVALCAMAIACNAFDEPPEEVSSASDPRPQPGPTFPATGIAVPGPAVPVVQSPPRAQGTCGNGVLQTGERCDDGNVLAGDGCSPSCQLEGCGDGVLQVNEICDDRNQIAGDGCAADCSGVERGWACPEVGAGCIRTECGNSRVEVGESCDDGNQDPFDGCNGLCQRERHYSCPATGGPCVPIGTCGNQLIDDGETCDDGGHMVGDGCSADCMVESGFRCPPGMSCGPLCADDSTEDAPGVPISPDGGVLGSSAEAGTGVPPGPLVTSDAGTSLPEPMQSPWLPCLPVDLGYPYCGDGLVGAGESCDDGLNTTLYGDGCAPGCRPPASCGDGVADGFGGEECDLGDDENTGAYGGCTETCTRAAYCGDGLLAPEEQCDDDSRTCVNCQLLTTP